MPERNWPSWSMETENIRCWDRARNRSFRSRWIGPRWPPGSLGTRSRETQESHPRMSTATAAELVACQDRPRRGDEGEARVCVCSCVTLCCFLACSRSSLESWSRLRACSVSGASKQRSRVDGRPAYRAQNPASVSNPFRGGGARSSAKNGWWAGQGRFTPRAVAWDLIPGAKYMAKRGGNPLEHLPA